MHMYSKNFSKFFLIFTASFALFISCSQNLPELTASDYSVIFDYSDNETLPEARLSVFATSESDVRRYERIQITSLDTGYTWETNQIARLSDEETQWAGCTNLKAPEDEKLPTGIYEVIYYNADEKEYKLTLDVKYDIELYNVLLPSLPDFMAENRGIEKIAVYDKEHILIYFGERTEEFKTTRDIWNKYREASFYQIIWYSSNGNVICITPEKPVSPEAEASESEENDEQ